ncbi:MAG: YvcK family protein [Erysipelotrichaceae bacterium]
MKKIVVIGGGTGLAVIIRGLKRLEDVKISAIVTVADDGGSTGRLRKQYNIPAMGDIRNVMVAMSESENLMATLMDYRFIGDDEDVGGHNLGNLILTALCESTGSFMEAVQTISKVLKVKGDIIPSSEQVISLYAKMSDGTIVRGESNIPAFDNQIHRVFYNEEVKASKKAIKAIKSADYIIYGIGSLYTSIIPNLIIEGIKQALKVSEAKKIYICNAMSQPGESDGYSLEDHVNALEDHSFIGAIDCVITHNNELNKELEQRYKEKGSYQVKAIEEHHNYQLLSFDILEQKDNYIRHDSDKIYKIFKEILEGEN